MIFNHTSEIPIDVLSYLMSRFEETLRVLNTNLLDHDNINGPRHEAFIRWITPLQGWMVLNMDGVVKGEPGPSCGGGLIRDNTGKMHYPFSINLGSCRAFTVEVRVVDFVFEMARRMHINKLQVQMDN